MKKYLQLNFVWLLIPPIFFFLYKILHFGIYYTDTNGYFYTAYSILQGKILYKDIFFTNLPLYPYIVVFYFIVLKGNLYAFYLVQILEIIGIACLIYYIVYKKTRSILITTLCGAAFLTSTYVYQSGGFGINVAIIFVLLAYIFLQKKRYILMGILLAFCFLTKAYFAPIVLAFFLALLLERKLKNTIPGLISFGCICIIVLMPFILLSFHNFWLDLFHYSLLKNGSFDRISTLGSFLFLDPLFFLLSLLSLITIKKDKLLWLISMCFYGYFFFTHAVYSYLLNMIIPFMAIYLAKPLRYIQELPEIGKLTTPVVMLLYFGYIAFIGSSFTDLNRVSEFDKMLSTIEQEKPNYLYGAGFITTALAYMSHTPLLNNLIDTDDLLFTNGILDSKKLTQEAIHNRSIVVVGGRLTANNAKEIVLYLPAVVDKIALVKKCQLLHAYPINGEQGMNRLLMFKCYK